MADELISLDLAENVLRIAKAKNEGGKIRVEVLFQQTGMPAFYESDTKKVSDETLTIINRSLDNLRLHKKRVNIVIPDGFTYSQIIKMPRLKEKELLSAIRYQADQFIPMPIDETSLDLEILYEDKVSNNSLVLIIAAPQKLIDRVQNLSEQVGLYPEAIENELSATGRFLENFYVPPSQTGGSIFVNFGYSYTSFYFFDHKMKLLLDSHNFPAGLSVFLREAQADVNIDLLKAKELLKKAGFASGGSVDLNQVLQPAVDALCSELQKYLVSLRSKFQISSISNVFVFNLSTEINYLDKKIEKCISIPCAVFDPISITNRTPAVEAYIKDLPSFITTIGGCLR